MIPPREKALVARLRNPPNGEAGRSLRRQSEDSSSGEYKYLSVIVIIRMTPDHPVTHGLTTRKAL